MQRELDLAREQLEEAMALAVSFADRALADVSDTTSIAGAAAGSNACS